MTALAVEQLDLFEGGDDGPSVVSVMEDGIGRVLYTRAGGWRARYTGSRYGWQIDRLTATPTLHRYSTGRWRTALVWEIENVWEQWEPDLPFGTEHVQDRELAAALLVAFSARHGDDPGWLLDYCDGALRESGHGLRVVGR